MPAPLKSSLRNRLRNFKAFCAIVRTTWLEAIQQPAAFLTASTSIAFTLIVPVLQMHLFGEEGRLARDSALSCLLLFGLVLAAGSAVKSVGGEINSGTAAAVIGKPVGRSMYLMAKMTGVYCVVLTYAMAQCPAMLLAQRCSAHSIATADFNGVLSDPLTLLLALASLGAVMLIAAILHYFRGVRFGASVFIGLAVSQMAMAFASQYTTSSVAMDFRALPAAVLVLFALAVFTSAVCALSVRLRPGAVFAGAFLLLFAGLAGDSLPPWLSGFIPDLQNFWLCDALAHGGTISICYILPAAMYALVCCALFAVTGCLMFQNRDL